ncbi:RluA family pseudouridine synthase [Pedomonas sp. V897]|uniref:RluA family pseudouridine synthase n=1 Tax=Pedomonas sp. V897 TaxID=3446482 RepID=UPI003EE11AF3
MSNVTEAVVSEEDDGIRVDRWFKRNRPDVSFTLVARWARTGALRLDGRKVTPGDRLAAGQVLRIPPVEEVEERPAVWSRPVVELTPDEIEYAQSLVIHRDDYAIVINKPPGLATQGGTKTKNHVDRLLDALKFGRPDKPRLVHRLDKDTSGVLLLARTANAAGFFSKAFAGRTAKKGYWALVVGDPQPDEGLIVAPLAKMPGTGGEKMTIDEKNGLPAKTRYRVIERAGTRAAWVEFEPLTGRTHQIRVHAAEALGCPIVGDAKYGGADAFLTGGVSRKLHLHARSLTIEHPSGKPLSITAPMAQHMRDSWEMFGFADDAPPREDDVLFDPLAESGVAAGDLAASRKGPHKRTAFKARTGDDYVKARQFAKRNSRRGARRLKKPKGRPS